MWLDQILQKVYFFNASDAINICFIKYVNTQSMQRYAYKYTTLCWWMVEYCSETTEQDTDGLVQNCSYSIANALGLLQPCTIPMMYQLP